jgi:hypothetical protein
MSFLVERDLAKVALAYDGPKPGPAFPPVAARIRDARQGLGLPLDELAQRVGLTSTQVFDLEAYNSQAYEVMGLIELQAFGAALGMPVMTLLFGEQPLRVIPSVRFLDVARAIESRVSTRGDTIEALSESVGWKLQPVVDDPGALASFTVRGLFDLCGAVGLDWLGVLVAMDADAAQQARWADDAS